MSDSNSQQPLSASAGEASPPPAALPDINAETYPFDTVLHLLDEAAYFTMFSIPDRGHCESIISGGGSGGVIGLKVRERLHRFNIVMQPPVRGHVATSNTISEQFAYFEHRWMFAPDRFPALPTR